MSSRLRQGEFAFDPPECQRLITNRDGRDPIMADVHDIPVDPRHRVGIGLQAAFREPGLLVVRPAHIDLIRHIPLGARPPMPQDHRQDRLPRAIHYLQKIARGCRTRGIVNAQPGELEPDRSSEAP